MSDGSAEPLWGYIASEPDTKPTRQGKPRFFAFAGEPKYQDEPDGSRTRVGTDYRPMVAYGQVAEAAGAKFARGDKFIAIGYTRPYSYKKDDKTVAGEEFVALGIGHDALRTSYDVDRSHRPARDASAQTPAASAKRGREVPPEFTAARTSAPAPQTLAR
ncbi:single-stranded DNA-binding protein [Microbacterium lacticum]|uniref:single-stranded DNA-binding protein n=1 Tax=Microbacterium lacticum TaxID=33885 RepID=UPI00242B3974|nr:single-stranded DNA-binding protein [Microbacterium lacticum]